MTRTSFHLAICAISVLAAAPAFAQGSQAAPQEDSAVQNSGTSARPSDMKSMGEHMKSRRSHEAMPAKNDETGDSAVDKLNEESLEAARSGQAFDASTPGSMPTHDGSAGTTGMSGEPMGNGTPPAQTPPK